MKAWLLAKLASLWGYLALAGGAVITFLIMLARARKEGREQAHRKVTKARQEEKTRARKKSDEIRRNKPRTDSDLRRRMRGQASDRDE